MIMQSINSTKYDLPVLELRCYALNDNEAE